MEFIISSYLLRFRRRSIFGVLQLQGGREEKENGRRREKKKNSLDQFPLANTITRLPGSSASCWQACWPPASLAQLPAAPRLPPEWGGLAGVKAPHAPQLGLLSVASRDAASPTGTCWHPLLSLCHRPGCAQCPAMVSVPSDSFPRETSSSESKITESWLQFIYASTHSLVHSLNK